MNPGAMLRRGFGALEERLKRHSETVYRYSLLRTGASLSPAAPDLTTRERNTTLNTTGDVHAAIQEAASLGLPRHDDDPKNWTNLQALKSLLAATTTADRVLFAETPIYQPLYSWLYLYGYRELVVWNADLDHRFAYGPIEFVTTPTALEPASFDAISCLSVIEEAIDTTALLEVCYRLLTEGGSMVVSGDYWSTGVETQRRLPSGETEPWMIYDEAGIRSVLETARSIGFSTPSSVDYRVDEPVVDYQDEQFTFIYFELRK